MSAIINAKKAYETGVDYLDPHTRDPLPFDESKALCDDLIEAHEDWLPKFE